MSYTSESKLGSRASLSRVTEIVTLLGYFRVNDGLKVPGRAGSYVWAEQKDYQSYVGVELDIYVRKSKKIVVTTRSRVGRSYWDIKQQNRTIKMLRDIFGGHFVTDAGRDRYWRPEGKPPSPVFSGCFLARWRLHNAFIKPKLYISQRGLDKPNAWPQPTGHYLIDEMNPRLFSNNLLIPYLVAVWEEYFRSSFIALLKYSPQREAALKKANLNQTQLESIASNIATVEDSVANLFSFQRPSIIDKNFKLLDSGMNLAGVLRKPYRRRKISLFDSIEHCVEDRNAFVHSGLVNINLTDQKLQTILADFEIGVERCYQEFGRRFKFVPQHAY